ncbi:hypothetical protein [Kyrpidia tusciae]|uniref:Group-specific protein n=1 Tax=Kyrpidia tusciae (strain DSM 2912 / NBRC 15312 / T2) TaxID=562970 RepID=D5WU08_KYRT2|nr:hypothetical protein [Kyrpidia tusciae]ADG05328.1 group-specific protein [Kyrpidia tusciae DSM 2912]
MKVRRFPLLALGLAFFLAGCAWFGASPTNVAQNYLTAVQKFDPEESRKWTESQDSTENSLLNPTDPTTTEMAKSLLTKMTFELGEENISGDKATVSAKITTLDLGRIVANSMKDLFSMALAQAFANDPSAKQQNEAMAQRILINAMNDPNAPNTTSDVKINLVKTKDGWKIATDNKDLFSALTGRADQLFGP